LDGDEPERVQSGSSSGDERVVGRGHQSRADSAPRRRRVLPDVDVATADTTTAKLGKFHHQHRYEQIYSSPSNRLNFVDSDAFATSTACCYLDL